MVTTNGVNRHMVLYINKQTEYELVVLSATGHQEYYAALLISLPKSMPKHLIWLRLMGLIETWDLRA